MTSNVGAPETLACLTRVMTERPSVNELLPRKVFDRNVTSHCRDCAYTEDLSVEIIGTTATKEKLAKASNKALETLFMLHLLRTTTSTDITDILPVKARRPP